MHPYLDGLYQLHSATHGYMVLPGFQCGMAHWYQALYCSHQNLSVFLRTFLTHRNVMVIKPFLPWVVRNAEKYGYLHKIPEYIYEHTVKRSVKICRVGVQCSQELSYPTCNSTVLLRRSTHTEFDHWKSMEKCQPAHQLSTPWDQHMGCCASPRHGWALHSA